MSGIAIDKSQYPNDTYGDVCDPESSSPTHIHGAADRCPDAGSSLCAQRPTFSTDTSEMIDNSCGPWRRI